MRDAASIVVRSAICAPEDNDLTLSLLGNGNIDRLMSHGRCTSTVTGLSVFSYPSTTCCSLRIKTLPGWTRSIGDSLGSKDFSSNSRRNSPNCFPIPGISARGR